MSTRKSYLGSPENTNTLTIQIVKPSQQCNAFQNLVTEITLIWTQHEYNQWSIL